MILAMSRVRILGPRGDLPGVLRALQDLGVVHLARSPAQGAIQEADLEPVELAPREERERRYLQRTLEDLERTLADLSPLPSSPARRAPARPQDFVRWVRLARRVRGQAGRLRERITGLEEERALLLKYRGFFSAFQQLLGGQSSWRNATAFSVLLRPREEGMLDELRRALALVVGDGFEMRAQPLTGGEVAVLILVPVSAAERVERALAEARVREIPVPEAYGGSSLAEAVPRMVERLKAIPRELGEADRERARLAREHGPELLRARQAVHDRLREVEALPLSRVTAHAFVLEGWAPTEVLTRLERALRERFGDTVVVREESKEEWAGEEAPVVLRNPRLFRPFEALVRLLPLPRYGTIDPTPFMAVFFPMFFGVILGDVGYGAALAVLALVLHARSRPGSLLRSAAEIAGPCAAFSILFGFLYGELFGDLGRRWLGLEPVLFDREEAVLPFLGLAVSIGLVHVLLGLGLGIASSLRGHPREAAGRGVAALMVLLIVAALLAAADVLPPSFFTPAVVALLVAFPVLVVLEGIIAPIELLATLGNVLSYARVMALGTASVMLAVVANRMVGEMGSAVVGVLFALLFHLVNFALGVFSPAIHALRLHYVEFFGKFYSPGGIEYRPFGHWEGT